MSLGLGMTACAIFMPTKANAVTLTVIPDGYLPRNQGDSVVFTLSLDPDQAPKNRVKFRGFEYQFDGTELSLALDQQPSLGLGEFVNVPRDVATVKFTVKKPLEDPFSDFFNVKVFYQLDDLPTQGTDIKFGGNVVPVPEPLTIFGTATALGCGVLFKRKSSKKTLS
jgi:hypothetical protein